MKKRLLILIIILSFFICCKNNSKSTSPTEPELHANCVLWGSITATKDYSGDAKFLGEIKNIGKRAANFVKITFTMYDENDKVIGVDFTYAKPTDLQPNQVGSFECWTNVQKSKIKRRKYVIEWDEF
jgi:hypothetical protein